MRPTNPLFQELEEEIQMKSSETFQNYADSLKIRIVFVLRAQSSRGVIQIFCIECYVVIFVSIDKVNAERVVYYRERASNMYPVLYYSISWTLAEVHKN